ncbi:hypothetical protein F0562_000413 [Nyssa sinensis]|uniref:Phospholipase A1 n=1 Tax=Nyssa sinensis TaxID=561372 RepID=A0A5J5C0I6_9ASTE|nr:hypothetical protein F0562_000413 [Nyssa sinensis]
MMAISLSKLVLPFQGPRHNISPSQLISPFKGHWHNMYLLNDPLPSLGRKLQFSRIAIREHAIRTPIKRRVTPENDSSPTVAELEREGKNEYDDEEMSKAKETEQKLVRNLEIDPWYCGSCKIKPSMFFQDLGWTLHRYEVTSYLYATQNANLPQFFTKSLQSNVWSPTENWIGYVAVSNDESSAYLGRRDIAIAWRGAVTSLEWMANPMDILHPISLDKIPSPDPMVKVQSGLPPCLC